MSSDQQDTIEMKVREAKISPLPASNYRTSLAFVGIPQSQACPPYIKLPLPYRQAVFCPITFEGTWQKWVHPSTLKETAAFANRKIFSLESAALDLLGRLFQVAVRAAAGASLALMPGLVALFAAGMEDILRALQGLVLEGAVVARDTLELFAVRQSGDGLQSEGLVLGIMMADPAGKVHLQVVRVAEARRLLAVDGQLRLRRLQLPASGGDHRAQAQGQKGKHHASQHQFFFHLHSSVENYLIRAAVIGVPLNPEPGIRPLTSP